MYDRLPYLPTPRFIEAWSKAYAFAARAHGEQKRKYTGDPYIVHPTAVAILVSWTPSATTEMIQAALLHDVVEDTVATTLDIHMHFGDEVRDMVAYLTDPPSTYGNRKVRKAEQQVRMAGAPSKVKTIKIADLIDNSHTIIAHDPDFARVYMAEKAVLLDALDGGDNGLWHEALAIVNKFYNRFPSAVSFGD